jgi:tRNA (cmo5U34)-methyltransferase
MTVHEFSFAAHAHGFDQHIRTSIRGYEDLRTDVVEYSCHFVKNGTRVIDVGCTTGTLLRSVRDAHQAARPSVDYLGIDVVPSFGEHWRDQGADNVRFMVRDARSHDFENSSLVIALFTLQFVPERDRVPLLRRIHDGLVEGGALIIAEKLLARSARFQDILTFTYYDFKLRSYEDKAILDKERELRGMMVCWEEARLMDALADAGFPPGNVQPIWRNHLFAGWLVGKDASRSWPTIIRPGAFTGPDSFALMMRHTGLLLGASISRPDLLRFAAPVDLPAIPNPTVRGGHD